MARSEYDLAKDEFEKRGLENTIANAERALPNASFDAKATLEFFLQNARGKVAVLEKRISETKAERDSRAKDVLVLASLAERETALSKSEQKVFGDFLKKDFFTKADFQNLESFYTQTWDRLSDGGKDEMSHRVWEGVRRSEYEFGELPKMVREKETEQAYKRLTSSSIALRDEGKIPAQDREEFINAYESGDREEASKVLSRKSFKEQMFRHGDSKGVKQAAVEITSATAVQETGKQLAQNADAQSKLIPPETPNNGDQSFSSVNLSGLKMSENSKAPTVADMPGKVPSGSPRSF